MTHTHTQQAQGKAQRPQKCWSRRRGGKMQELQGELLGVWLGISEITNERTQSSTKERET